MLAEINKRSKLIESLGEVSISILIPSPLMCVTNVNTSLKWWRQCEKHYEFYNATLIYQQLVV